MINETICFAEWEYFLQKAGLALIGFFILWKFIPVPSFTGRISMKSITSIEKYKLHRVQEKLQRSQIQLDYNPATCATLRHFASVKANSKCLFAKQSRLWGSKSYCSEISLEGNIAASLPAIIKFATLSDDAREKLDGFVIEVKGDQYCKNVSSFAATVRKVLNVISNNDPASVHCMAMETIDRPSWHFTFCASPLFITTFAPFYSANHARYMYPDKDTTESCFIMLQPESSFLRHDIGRDSPHTNFECPQTMRDKIRCSFFSADQKYYIHPSNQYPVSISYVASPELTIFKESELCTQPSMDVIKFWDELKYPDLVPEVP